MKKYLPALIFLIFILTGCEEQRTNIKVVQKYRVSVISDKEAMIKNYLDEADSFFENEEYGKALELYKKVLLIDPENEKALNATEKIKQLTDGKGVVEKQMANQSNEKEGEVASDEKQDNSIIESEEVSNNEEELIKAEEDYLKNKEREIRSEIDATALQDEIKRKEEENRKLKKKADIYKALQDARKFAMQKKFKSAEDVLKKVFLKYPEEAESIEKVLIEIRRERENWMREKEERLKEKRKLKMLEKKLAELKGSKKKKEKLIKKKKKKSIQDIIDEKYLFESLPAKLTYKDKIDFLEKKTLEVYIRSLAKAYYWLATYYQFQDVNLPKALHFYEKLCVLFPDSIYVDSAKKNASLIKKYLEGALSKDNLGSLKNEMQKKILSEIEIKKQEVFLDMYLENVGKAYYWIGNYYRKKGMNDKAVYYLKQLYEDVPESVYADDALFEVAEIYYEQGDLDTALLQYYSVIDNYPRTDLYKKVYLRLASIYRKQGRFEKALDIYKDLKDIEVKPDKKQKIMLEIAKTYTEAGKFEKSIPILKKILEMKPKSKFYDEAQFYLGYTFYKKKDYKTARVIFEAIRDGYSFNPFRDDAIYTLAESYYKEKMYAKCIEALEMAMRYYPEYIEIDRFLVILGKCYEEIGKYDLAEKAYKKVLDKYSESMYSLKACYGIAKSLEKQKKIDSAAKYFKELIKKYPNTDKAVKARFELGKIYYEMGNYKKALKNFQFAKKNLGEDVSALKTVYYMALCYEKQKNYDKAIEILEKNEDKYLKLIEKGVFSESEKKEIENFLYNVLQEKANLFALKGDVEKAVEVYKTVIEKYPDGKDNDWIYYRMGRIMENAGNIKQAVEFYNKDLSDYGDSYWAKQSKWRLKNIKWQNSVGAKAQELGGIGK